MITILKAFYNHNHKSPKDIIAFHLSAANWKKNKMGDLSTAGTTASTVIFRQDHIIVANVGDSTAVLGNYILSVCVSY